MEPELLSICIPTYNRSGLLRDLLEAVARQARQHGLTRDLAFYISDNASTDATPQVVEAFARDGGLRVVSARNPSNLGISRNLLNVIRMGKGRYCWTLGDDEIVHPEGLARLVRNLRDFEPGLVVAFDTHYPWKLPPPRLYATYRDFSEACVLLDNVHPLAEHTLLSSNIFRTDCFDMALAEARIQTFFPHMFGFLRPVIQRRLPVLIPDFPLITTRQDDRGAPSDGVWADLDDCWNVYLSWLREEMDLPGLDPEAPSRMARREMFRNLRAHPLAYLRKNWRALRQPSAYRFLLSRIFGVRKRGAGTSSR